MTTNNIDAKHIRIKIPYTFLGTFIGITMLLGSTVSWWSGKLSDILFWIVFSLCMGMAVYSLCLLYRFYSTKSIKQIVINADDDVVFVYQIFRYGNSYNRDYSARKQNIRIVIKGNRMNLLEKNNPIAKVYRGTMNDRNDWEWLVNYFS